MAKADALIRVLNPCEKHARRFSPSVVNSKQNMRVCLSRLPALLFRHDLIGINFKDNTDEYDAEVGTILRGYKDVTRSKKFCVPFTRNLLGGSMWTRQGYGNATEKLLQRFGSFGINHGIIVKLTQGFREHYALWRLRSMGARTH
jgi:hypothetical protein